MPKLYSFQKQDNNWIVKATLRLGRISLDFLLVGLQFCGDINFRINHVQCARDRWCGLLKIDCALHIL
jgi:hypothetical protein